MCGVVAAWLRTSDVETDVTWRLTYDVTADVTEVTTDVRRGRHVAEHRRRSKPVTASHPPKTTLDLMNYVRLCRKRSDETGLSVPVFIVH